MTEESSNDMEQEWQDLMGKDLQMKITESKSDPSAECCEVGTLVKIDFVGHCSDENGPVFHDVKDWLICVGDKDILPAIEMAVRFLRETETAVVKSHSKYAYGPSTRKNGDYELPPNSNVFYTVKVQKIVDDCATEEELAASRKLIGNDVYQNEWSNGLGKGRALYLYKKATDAMIHLLNHNASNENARNILVDCLNNTAAVHLRAKEYGQAKEAATRVLMYDPDNLKALCRAARAAMLDPAGTYEESDLAISAAEEVNGGHPDVVKLRAELTRRKREYKKKSKAMFSRPTTKPIETAPNASKEEETETMTSDKDKTSCDEQVTSSLEESSSADDEKSWFEVLLPHVLQMVLPFLFYYLIMYMKQTDDKDESLRTMKEQKPDSEF